MKIVANLKDKMIENIECPTYHIAARCSIFINNTQQTIFNFLT